ISPDIKLTKEFTFRPISTRPYDSTYDPVIDGGVYGNDFPVWLDNKTLYTQDGIFDIEKGTMLPTATAPSSQKLIFGSNSKTCSEENIKEYGCQCYPVHCQQTGDLFDFSAYQKTPRCSDGEVGHSDSDPNGYLPEEDLKCAVKRSSKVIFIKSSQLSDDVGPWIFTHIDGTNQNAILDFGSLYDFEKIKSTYFSKADSTSKLDVIVTSIQNYLHRNYYPVHFDKKIASNGIGYAMESKYVSSIGTNALVISSLIIYDTDGKEKGRISRRWMEVIGQHANEKNEILMVTEKGIERVILK
ncbi:MAG: hypothetical protein Q7S61_02815, partial [bacterium]|nr:hypothetical protein [bacterium]